MIPVSTTPLAETTFIDLFAGIGGFRTALESLGSTCVFSSEIDKHAAQTYHANYGECPHGDITQIAAEDIPDHDILCAGFPCQAFSISGKQLGFADTRGTLFFDIARIVKVKKPRVVFMENVKNFATHDKGNTMQVVRTTMTQLGYNLYAKVLNAADYGVPQKRQRIYMVAIRKDVDSGRFKFPSPVELETFVEDILLVGSVDEKLTNTRWPLQFAREDVNENVANTVRLGIVNRGGQGDRIYSTKGVGVTLSAQGGGTFSKTGGYLMPDGTARKLHPRECARMMGFDDSFIYHDSFSQAYKQFGNSVVVDVLQYIALEFAHIFEENVSE